MPTSTDLLHEPGGAHGAPVDPTRPAFLRIVKIQEGLHEVIDRAPSTIDSPEVVLFGGGCYFGQHDDGEYRLVHLPNVPALTVKCHCPACKEGHGPSGRTTTIAFETEAPPLKGSQASDLVAIGRQLHPFRTPDGVPHVVLGSGGHREAARLDDDRARKYLSRQYYGVHGRAPSPAALDEALETLKASALFDGPEERVYIRVAPAPDGGVLVDLADGTGRAAHVTPEGWSVVAAPGVLFRRGPAMGALPEPVHGPGPGAGLSLLVRHVPVDEWALVLVLAWAVQALRPRGPYPVLAVQGEQGSGKSVFSRRLRALVDPNAVPLRSIPGPERDLVLSAENQWVCAFDNLSGVRPETADALCRLATGGGFATRTLYSNRSEELFDVTRPVIVNGIESLLDRPDLGSRAVPVMLRTIGDGDRRTEADLDAAFEADRPAIFGGLLDALSASLRPVDHPTTLGRMADFEAAAHAAEAAFPPGLPTVAQALARSAEALVDEAMAGSPIGDPILSLLQRSKTGDWVGTSGDLVVALRAHLPDGNRPGHDFPRGGQQMGRALARVLPALNRLGVRRETMEREGPKGRRVFRLVHDRQG